MDDQENSKAETLKERAKRLRKEAYQKAKARRDADPKYQAYKEEQKQRRKDYQKKIKQETKEESRQKKSLAQDKKELWDFVKKGSELLNSQHLETSNSEKLDSKTEVSNPKNHLRLVKS